MLSFLILWAILECLTLLGIELYANELEFLTIDPPLGAIVLRDTGPVQLNISYANSNLFGLITTQNGVPYSLAVTGVSLADAHTLLSNPFVQSVGILDTAANIQVATSNLGAFIDTHINSIASINISDSGTLDL